MGRTKRACARRGRSRIGSDVAFDQTEGTVPLPLLLQSADTYHDKVDTTGVTETSNPVRFGQEFQGRIANPRDVLVFHRAKKSTRGGKVNIEQPELSIDDPNLSTSEKLSKVRVHTLVHEYLTAQELQLLGEPGMSDAIELFVDKDDIHAISKYVPFCHVIPALK